MKMKAIKRIYSVNNTCIQFKVDMSSGETYSAAMFEYSTFNVKLVIDSKGADMSCIGSSVEIISTDVDVVKSAIWLIANGFLADDFEAHTQYSERDIELVMRATADIIKEKGE